MCDSNLEPRLEPRPESDVRDPTSGSTELMQYVYILLYTHPKNSGSSGGILYIYIYIYVFVFVLMCVHTYLITQNDVGRFIHTYFHICVYIRTYAYVYVDNYVNS